MALDASGSAEEIFDTSLQCLEEYQIYIRDENTPVFRPPHSSPQRWLAPEENVPSTEHAMSGDPVEDTFGDLVGTSQLYIADEDFVDNRRSSARRSSMYKGAGSNRRQSMGVYGAMLKMDW